MLFENPAVAAKLPFPYNVPPPLQAAAAAAAVPNLRWVFRKNNEIRGTIVIEIPLGNLAIFWLNKINR